MLESDLRQDERNFNKAPHSAKRVFNARGQALQTNKRTSPSKKPRKTAGAPISASHNSRHERPRSISPAARGAIADALIQQSRGASLDQALTKTLKNTKDLHAQDRRDVVQNLYGINRHRARLSWHLEQVEALVTPGALFSAWLAFSSRGTTWSEEAGVEDLPLMRKLTSRELNERTMPEAARLECPPAFESHLREALQGNFSREMRAALEAPPVDLRINLLKADAAEAIKRLHWDKVEAKPTPFSPWGLRCAPGTNVSATRCFQDGLIEFQDEGSQLAALICDVQPGMQVMDFCSGTGGKTLALAAAMQNKGHIVACDISEVRLARSKIRLKRAGAENAERIKLPAVDDKAMKKLYGKFHRVLVDAPCSGTGSWRRNPDVRWSTHAAKLDELIALQSSILERAARFVQPGGYLIYATCSLLPQENDEQIKSFLSTREDFELVNARKIWEQLSDKAWPSGEEQFLRLSPARHGTDGFFTAILRKATIPA